MESHIHCQFEAQERKVQVGKIDLLSNHAQVYGLTTKQAMHPCNFRRILNYGGFFIRRFVLLCYNLVHLDWKIKLAFNRR
ncbi:hypothetical protein CMK12_06720 [Candidatus Poribacteria bacterium]|nr:hypothetical protein [Candidatus Poribacteria bacterium]